MVVCSKNLQVLARSTISDAFSRNQARFATFAKKFTQTRRHLGLLEKVAHFGQIDDFSCFFAKLGTFCNFLLKSWRKRLNLIVSSKKLHIFAESTIFHAFLQNEALLAGKFTQTLKHGSLLEKNLQLGKIGHFSCFFAEWRTFCNFFLKSWPKRRDFVLCSKKLHTLAESAIFHAFSRNEALFATFWRKVDSNGKRW